MKGLPDTPSSKQSDGWQQIANGQKPTLAKWQEMFGHNKRDQERVPNPEAEGEQVTYLLEEVPCLPEVADARLIVYVDLSGEEIGRTIEYLNPQRPATEKDFLLGRRTDPPTVEELPSVFDHEAEELREELSALLGSAETGRVLVDRMKRLLMKFGSRCYHPKSKPKPDSRR